LGRGFFILSNSRYDIFFRGPLAITFMVLSILAFIYPLVKDKITSKKGALADTIKGVDGLEDALDRDST
jgi:TctA family transporter